MRVPSLRATFFTDFRGLGRPLPEMPPAHPQRGTSTGEEIGGHPSVNSLGKPKCGRRRRRRPHFGLPSDFSEGVLRTLNRVWCIAEGVPGAFPEGVSPDTGNPCRKKPGDWGLSRGVNPFIQNRRTMHRACMRAVGGILRRVILFLAAHLLSAHTDV